MLKRVQTLKPRIDRQNKPTLNKTTLGLILKHKKLEKSLQIALTEDQAIYEETVTSRRRFSDLQKYLNKINSSSQNPQKMFYTEKSTRDDTPKATFSKEFFISVYQKESNLTPLARNTNCSPTEEICPQKHLEETKIELILKNLLTNKASGLDSVGKNILKTFLKLCQNRSIFSSAHSLKSGSSRPSRKQVKWPQFLEKKTIFEQSI